MPPKADKRVSRSPKRELAMRPAPATNGNKGKSRSQSIEVVSDNDEHKEQQKHESSTAKAEAFETKSQQDDQKADGTTDAQAGYDSDSFDPAIFDAEEMPDDDVNTKPASDAASDKPSFVGAGYNSLKSFGGQVYSGMAIGGSHTWYALDVEDAVRPMLNVRTTRNYQPGVWKVDAPQLDHIRHRANERLAGDQEGA